MYETVGKRLANREYHECTKSIDGGGGGCASHDGTTTHTVKGGRRSARPTWRSSGCGKKNQEAHNDRTAADNDTRTMLPTFPRLFRGRRLSRPGTAADPSARRIVIYVLCYAVSRGSRPVRGTRSRWRRCSIIAHRLFTRRVPTLAFYYYYYLLFNFFFFFIYRNIIACTVAAYFRRVKQARLLGRFRNCGY